MDRRIDDSDGREPDGTAALIRFRGTERTCGVADVAMFRLLERTCCTQPGGQIVARREDAAGGIIPQRMGHGQWHHPADGEHQGG